MSIKHFPEIPISCWVFSCRTLYPLFLPVSQLQNSKWWRHE